MMGRAPAPAASGSGFGTNADAVTGADEDILPLVFLQAAERDPHALPVARELDQGVRRREAAAAQGDRVEQALAQGNLLAPGDADVALDIDGLW